MPLILAHIPYIIFLFALGSCVGSFLNVVVWRLPRGESIVSPPSHCPKCNTKLAWYDNIPVFGWIALKGKCRYCGQGISFRYPLIEALTGGLFVLYYIAMFIYQEGPCAVRPMSIDQDWPMYALYVFTIAGLLASSLIDLEYFIVPIEIPWLIMAVAIAVHAIIDMPMTPGALNAMAPIGAMSAGAGLGVVISILLMHRGILAQSFAEGAPLMEIEKKAIEDETAKAKAEGREPEAFPQIEFTRAQLRGEMQKEMLFLLPALLLGGAWLVLTWKVAPIAAWWNSVMAYHWLSGFLGAMWGALMGAFLIWFVRIAGTIGFGREAMGMGDVHLMLGIGAVIGAAGSAIVFFVAPFIGLIFAMYKLIFRRGREVPYVPYLSMATAVVMLFYCRIIMYLDPSVQQLAVTMRQRMQGQ